MCLSHLVLEKICENVEQSSAILKTTPYANLCTHTFVTSLDGFEKSDYIDFYCTWTLLLEYLVKMNDTERMELNNCVIAKRHSLADMISKIMAI